MFAILGISDGGDDLGTIQGQSGEFTEGMSFNYIGDNKFIDHILNEGVSFNIFKNQSPSYINGIANDPGVYKTIGTSFEFGGLEDGTGVSTKQNLMKEYLTFFGITIPTLTANFAGYPTDIYVGDNVNFYNFSTGAVISYEWSFPGGTPETSTEAEPVIFYNEEGTYDVILTVSDGTTTNTMTKEDYIIVDNITGVGNTNESLSCLVLPNPNSGTFRIRISVLEEEFVNLKIFNTMGTLVYSEDAIPVNNKLDKAVNLSTAPNGIYIISVQSKTSSWTGKVVISK